MRNITKLRNFKQVFYNIYTLNEKNYNHQVTQICCDIPEDKKIYI